MFRPCQGIAGRGRREMSAPAWPEADGADEVVDLAVPLAVDDAAGGPFGAPPPGRAAQASSAIAVLHRLDVPKVVG